MGGRAARASLRDAGIGGAGREDATPRSKRRRPIASPAASANSIACSAAASCPARSCCSAASPASASRRLLLQAAANFAQTVGTVLYASGEESEHQIKSRGDRLGVGDAPFYPARRDLHREHPRGDRPRPPQLLVVDSVQTVFSLKFQSAPGSIGQVREAATQFLFTAKGHNIPTFLVGHVTKDGNIAGPKALEHVVDTVLYFEGERHHSHRVVRAVKNRFGAISELGVFEMTGARPASRSPIRRRCFLPSGRRRRRDRRCCARSEGSRPILVEVQALAARRRTAWRSGWRSGIDPNRLSLLARGAREARRAASGHRRRVRQHRRRHDHRRAGRRPGIVSAVASSVRNRPLLHGDRGVRRGGPGRRSARRAAGGPADSRSRADGIHPHRPARGERRRE